MAYVPTYFRNHTFRNPINDFLDAFVQEAWNEPAASAHTRYDLYSDEKAFYLEVELPGVAKEKVDVEVEKGKLIVKAEYPEKEGEFQYARRGRSYGKVEERFKIGPNLDAQNLQAKFEDGVLQLKIPLKPEAAARKIEIS